jgi:hypothetical protein
MPRAYAWIPLSTPGHRREDKYGRTLPVINDGIYAVVAEYLETGLDACLIKPFGTFSLVPTDPGGWTGFYWDASIVVDREWRDDVLDNVDALIRDYGAERLVIYDGGPQHSRTKDLPCRGELHPVGCWLDRGLAYFADCAVSGHYKELAAYQHYGGTVGIEALPTPEVFGAYEQPPCVAAWFDLWQEPPPGRVTRDDVPPHLRYEICDAGATRLPEPDHRMSAALYAMVEHGSNVFVSTSGMTDDQIKRIVRAAEATRKEDGDE